ncbi:MAG: hydroxyethylthiazole kinase [Thermodesulfobacteriota bacterium]
MPYAQGIWQDVLTIRERQPLVVNLTNTVVTNVTANALLALGASPIMTESQQEIGELVALSQALVLNIGTLHSRQIALMQAAAAQAQTSRVPVVLDPVGAGASRLRTETALALLQNAQPEIVRGNASEILALAGEHAHGSGVDSRHLPQQAQKAAQALAQQFGCIVCVSGEEDVVTNGREFWYVRNGHALMAKVTGTGCMATALIGGFRAVNDSALTATVNAMGLMGVAGEMAGGQASGPGTFQASFFDALFSLSEIDISAQLDVEAEDGS